MPEPETFGEFIDLFRWLPNAIATSLVQLESSVRGGDDPPDEAAFLDDMRTLTAHAVHHFFEHSRDMRAVIILSQVEHTFPVYSLPSCIPSGVESSWPNTRVPRYPLQRFA